MEGINHGAIGLAGHLKLGRLNVLWDDNRITIDGATSLSTSEDIAARYAATGWHTVACDGHDPADIARAIDAALADSRPSLIACRTIIGYGAPNKQGSHSTHGSPLGGDEIAAARVHLGWEHAPFEIPADVRLAWEAAGRRSEDAVAAWDKRFAASPSRAEFERRMKGELPVDNGLKAHIAGLLPNPQKIATRKASEIPPEAINNPLPDTPPRTPTHPR